MEDWEAIIETYPDIPNLRFFNKAVKTAETVLKEDLAVFEAEWITNTLFYKPVDLFNTVTSKRSDIPWAKPICDGFKLIGSVVEKYPVEHLIEDIVTLCLVQYTPQIRKDALQCLAKVVVISSEGAREVTRLIAELEEAETCRSPLAVVVGSIAEHHPELVAEDIHKIWRIYLNLLESNKNSDTVIASVLQGLTSLFKHFGCDLPIVEFNDLYTRISRNYILKKNCVKVCILMLEKYSDLFKELLANDRQLREFLWSESYTDALRSVYVELATAVDKQKLQRITDTELLPRTTVCNSAIKYTALRIAKHMVDTYDVTAVTEAHTAVQVVEQELRNGNVTIDTADEILWCIESNSLYSERLLQAAILFYSNIPSSKRRNIVYGFLNAKHEDRTAALTFLINESCQPTEDNVDNIEKYLPLWKDLFDFQLCKDITVAEKGKLVFTGVMDYVFTVLQSVLDEEHETLPEKINPLLNLTYHILSLVSPDEHTEIVSRRLQQLLRNCSDCSATASLLSALTATVRHCDDSLAGICQTIRIDKCTNESVLCESCHLFIQVKPEDVSVENVLQALEILFTRRDVEPQILSMALQRFASILHKEEVSRERVNYIISLVNNLRSHTNMGSKEARILHRDVIIFLGKYGNDGNTVQNTKENKIISKLKNKLLMNILHTNEAVTYKLNLQRILQQAVVYEDTDALQKLLAVISLSLSRKHDPIMQLSLTVVIRALCRAPSKEYVDVTSLQQAVLLCRSVDCVSTMLVYISEEKFPGARKMLSDALEGLLMNDPGSTNTETLVRTVADGAMAMMASRDATTRSGGLNIVDTLLSVLKDNHSLQQELLPVILTLIFETKDIDARGTFQTASEIFLDNLRLYDDLSIDRLIKKLSKSLLTENAMDNDIDIKLFKHKVTEIVSLFVDLRRFVMEPQFLENLSNNCSVVLYFISEYKMMLDSKALDDILEIIKHVQIRNDLAGIFVAEAVLKFFEVYADDVLEKKLEATKTVIRIFIMKLCPRHILKLQKQLQTCLPLYTRHFKPVYFEDCFEDCFRKFNVKKLIQDIRYDNICDDYINVLKSLRILADAFNVTVSAEDSLLKLCDVVLSLYIEHDEKYIEIYKEYFCDLLDLNLRFLPRNNLKEYLIRSRRKNPDYVTYFIGPFCGYLLKKPFVLLEEDMWEFAGSLKDLLKLSLKKKHDQDYYKNLLELVHSIWPIFDERSTFDDKYTVLHLVNRLPYHLHADTKPVRWAVGYCDTCSVEEKIKLVRVLPGGERCWLSYRALASHLPTRFSELTGVLHSALQALLDALAVTADNAVLDIVMNLAECDPSKGWWDEAIASSIASLARRGDATLARVKVEGANGNAKVFVEEEQVSLISIANKLFNMPSARVCNRLLIPLLRYSGPTFCETFYSGILNNLMATLTTKPRECGDLGLIKLYRERARAFSLITLAFEQISISCLQSPNSLLYSNVPNRQTFNLIRQACKLCELWRRKEISQDASDELKKCYKLCQIENYKCFCSAVCLQRPAEKFYDYLFGEEVWARVIDSEVEYKLPIQSHWNQQRTYQMTSVELKAGLNNMGTVRTRMFLRTLSEDPLQYDLLGTQQESNAQELELTINELNCQEVSGTLTALMKHASSLTHHRWRTVVGETLVGGANRNVKWTLAQVICNCKEDLIPHAEVLRPALLEMVASTPCDCNGKRTLNGLHVEVLQTVLFWENSQLPQTCLRHLTASVEYLINSAIDCGQYRSVFNSLLAILKKLAVLFDVFGQREFIWNGYEEHMKAPEKLKWLFQIALALSKQKLKIPNLLQTLSEMDDKFWSEPNLPELFGYVLACESETAIPLARYRKFLARKRQTDVSRYVKMLWYSQMGSPAVIDEANFKIVADLAPKLPGDNKFKCLNILAAYLENASESNENITDMFETIDICSLIQDNTIEALRIVKHGFLMMDDRLKRNVVYLVLEHTKSGDVKVRKMALEVAVRVFEGFYAAQPSEPPSKKPKSSTSRLLLDANQPERSELIKYVARGLTDPVTSIADTVRDSVANCLNTTDFGIRLMECFLLCIALNRRQQNLSVCVSAFLQLLFRDLRGSSKFRDLKLSEEPLEVSESAFGSSKLLTNSKTYCGSFLSSSRKRAPKKKDLISSGINVQISIDDVIATLFHFAKNKSDVSQSLCVEVIKSVVERSSSGFDVGPELSRLVCDVLSSTPTDTMPLAIEVGRMFVDHIVRVPGFQNHLDKLRISSRTAEGEFLTTLLYEDVQLRTNDDFFILGVTNYEDNMDVEELLKPSLTDIMSAFGKLSDWDKLTLQQKKDIERIGLPQLWVKEDIFKSWLDEYEVPNTKSWFNKLIVTYRDESKRDSLRWLRETDRWPRRHFDISTIAETLQRSVECSGDAKLCCDIRPRDCLAEWAARIMLRRAYVSDMDSDGYCTRDMELIWCRSANDRALSRLAINCIDVHKSSLTSSENLSWTIEKARALRTNGLESSNNDLLNESLSMLESFQFEITDSDDDVILLNKLILTFNHDLGTVTKDKIADIMETLDQNTERQVSKKNKDNLWSLYEIAMNYFDGEWEKDAILKSELISNMADILGRVIDLNFTMKAEMFLSVILNRLEDVKKLDEDTSIKILDKIDLLIDYIDDFSIESFESKATVFPRDILAKYPRLSRNRDAMLLLYRQLSLVRDPCYGLLRRCEELRLCDDPFKWKNIMDILKENIFENPFALESTEYRLLFKYKEDLYGIEQYEASVSSQKNAVLNKVLEDLAPRVRDRDSLRLSQLCPALTRAVDCGSERDRAMSRLLLVGKLSVVKFYEQVSVFTNAITRPAVLKVLLSDGSTRKYIMKSGESLRLAGASQRACKAATLLWGEDCFVGHSVTPLSGDSGLIGYLEDTVTFNQLIASEHDLKATYDRLERSRVSTSPLDRYKTYCSHIPAYTLRSAIEKNCSSTEDFIQKKQRFLQTYSGLTLLGSIFGLGDRHLENLLYMVSDGSACAIDWGAVGHYCLTEPVPARLTRNVRALLAGTGDNLCLELESYLQRLLTTLRCSHKLFLNVVQLSFKWKGDDFLDQFNNISLFVRGEATTYDIVDISLSRLDNRKKHECILKVLRDIFEDDTKRRYSVVEQITCLLRHCTHPLILAHTRDGWEPWI